MSFTAGQCSYSLHYQPASKNQQHHLLLWDSKAVRLWEPRSSSCWSVVCPLFEKTHNYFCLYSVVLYCVVIHLARAVCCAEAASESHYCVWLTVVDETIAFKLRKSKDWLWFRYLCSFFFLNHTLYLGTIMTSSSSQLEMKQMSIHFSKWWNIDFCHLVQCSLDFGHFCNGSKGGMPLTNTLYAPNWLQLQ